MRRGEHGRVPAQRLADEDRAPKPQPFDDGDDIGDVGGARDVPRVALTGAVPALVDRDDPVPGAQVPCRRVPFTRVTGQAVQQHDGLPRPAPVPADEPDTVSHDLVLGPPFARLPARARRYAAHGAGQGKTAHGANGPTDATGADCGG
ncbi:hypothetical protein SAMN04487981_110126 [Streptomyces sp. cf386]|nr:hypothetical protein SAMN04487981_110126 [Streptomyces sp. cf386]